MLAVFLSSAVFFKVLLTAFPQREKAKGLFLPTSCGDRLNDCCRSSLTGFSVLGSIRYLFIQTTAHQREVGGCAAIEAPWINLDQKWTLAVNILGRATQTVSLFSSSRSFRVQALWTGFCLITPLAPFSCNLFHLLALLHFGCYVNYISAHTKKKKQCQCQKLIGQACLTAPLFRLGTDFKILLKPVFNMRDQFDIWHLLRCIIAPRFKSLLWSTSGSFPLSGRQEKWLNLFRRILCC